MSAESPEFTPVAPLPEVAQNPERVIQFKQTMERNVSLRAEVTPEQSPQETQDKTTKVLEKMAAKADLLEDLGDNASPEEDEQAPEPALTVCIPVAVTREDPEKVAHTVSLIKRSQQNLGKPVDVIVWANDRYDEGDEASTQEAAATSYAAMKEKLQPIDGDGLHIQTALEVLPKDEATMVDLRSNYMDAVSVKAAQRGYGVEHPVLWMDADTTELSPDALGMVEQSVRNFDAMLVHTNIRYNLDWANGTSFDELDDASKAVAIYELGRRQHARFEQAIGTADSGAQVGYNDEPGMAFALGSYLAGGGLHQQAGERRTYRSGVDESHILEANIARAREHLPEAVFQNEDRETAKRITYLEDARMGVSNRRLYRDVQERGTDAFRWEERGEYVLASDAPKPSGEAPAPISGTELKKIVQSKRTREQDEPLYSWDPDLRASKLEHGFIDPTPEVWRAQRVGARIVDRMIDQHLPK